MYKYKKIRLEDGSTIDEHRLVWQEAYGPIPDGMLVHHKNENGRDNRLENLELHSRAEHARFHMTDKKRPWQRRELTHGTMYAYQQGCRCPLCKTTNQLRVQRGRANRGGR